MLDFDRINEELMRDSRCDHCGGNLILVAGYAPYTEDYLMCPNCDSTYTIYCGEEYEQ